MRVRSEASVNVYFTFFGVCCACDIEARQTSIAVNAAFMMWFFILFLFFSFSKIAIHKFIKIPGPMKVGRVFFRCRQRIL